MRASGNRRERGAYYTPSSLARALAEWAIRSPKDVVIDPAAGRGELLAAARDRLLALGAKNAPQLWGVELHRRTFENLVGRLRAWNVPKRNFICGDFFESYGDLPHCSVVLMNPPYVRHQQIPSSTLIKARASLDGSGASVDGKASAWAYFVTVAPRILAPGGRMAAVLPTDVLSSDYATEVLAFLRRIFSSIELVYCNGELFEGLSQRTVLCLADLRRSQPGEPSELRLRTARIPSSGLASSALITSGPSKTVLQKVSLPRLLASKDVLMLEDKLRKRADLRMLGSVARIGIGYVTGDNRFFHQSGPEVATLELKRRDLTPVVRREREVTGIRYTRTDWQAACDAGKACWLLTPENLKSSAVGRLLRRRAALEARKRYKCRRRSPWWVVPLDAPPPAFMIYMGTGTRIVANDAGLHVSNSFFKVTELKEASPIDLAAGSLTSVFELSAVLNCRLIGGGLRKLEPSDAHRVLVPVSRVTGRMAKRLDRLVREGRWAEVRRAADDIVLRKGLKWGRNLVAAVQAALVKLQENQRLSARP